MRIEGRDLINLGERQPHFLGQRGKTRGREVTVAILDQMQVLNEKIAAALAVAKERAHFAERFGIDLTALGGAAGAVSGASDRRGRLISDAHKVLIETQNRYFAVGTSPSASQVD